MKDQWALVLAALWWGSLTTLGFLVVPMLFSHLPSPALAGAMAARMFSAQAWVGMGCGLLLLMILGARRAGPAGEPPAYELGLTAAAMLLALLVEFGVAPRIMARENLKLWHGIGSALYGLQWLLAGLLLWRLGRDRAR